MTLKPSPEPASDVDTEVVRNPNRLIRSSNSAAACLVQIYPSNAHLGRRYLLEQAVTLGRDDSCDVNLDEQSVSRCHAQIVPKGDHHFVTDLRSTNGTFVNDAAVMVRQLNDGDYVRVGNHIFRFLTGGNIEADYHEEIFRLTITDALTGAHNKRHLYDFLERELTRSARHHRPLALVLLDIDHFKAINDRYGHLAGDTVLRGLAGRLRGDIRRDELFARYGGEEFAVVLPETDAAGAHRFAERLRALVADQPFSDERTSYGVTISLGIATTPGTEPLTPAEFLARADANLYRAKDQGRNCVVV